MESSASSVASSVFWDLCRQLGVAITPEVDLHDPTLDATGRTDVLAARLLRSAMAHCPDAVTRMAYEQLRPVIDAQIHKALGSLDLSQTLERMGIAPKAKAGSRARRTGAKAKANGKGSGAERVRKTRKAGERIYEAEFL